MALLSFESYRVVLREPAFRRFWPGFTFSILGDSMTRVALTWHVYETTRASAALGWLALCYTGPVAVSGFLAASLLDRLDRRAVMVAACVIRGAVMTAIPVLHVTGPLALWHAYAAAAAWGALMMLTLAGTPALLPALVRREHLATANALETLSYTVVGVIGPPLAGRLAPRVGAPNLLIVDACSYVVFAVALLAARPAHDPTRHQAAGATWSLGDVARLLARHPVLVSTTLMFMAWNVGCGALHVWLPVVAAQTLGGGAGLYGALLGVFAAGEVASALLAGSLGLRWPLGTLICRAQTLSGLALLPVAAPPAVATGLLGLALYGAASAPLTIWAQTLRMRILPEDVRGRAFAILRTIMQGAPRWVASPPAGSCLRSTCASSSFSRRRSPACRVSSGRACGIFAKRALPTRLRGKPEGRCGSPSPSAVEKRGRLRARGARRHPMSEPKCEPMGQPTGQPTGQKDAARGHAVVVQPGGGPSYWQPVPANGHADPALHPAVTRFEGLSMGYQTIAPGGRIREHSHGDQVELQICFRGRGRVVVDGVSHPLAPGTACFLGYDVRHEILNESDEELVLLWVVAPPGLEHFFEAIGRPRRAGEPTPAPFARPADVVAIERSLGLNDT